MTLIEIAGRRPKVATDCFVAENATISGDVELEEGSSVWFGASLRAEYEKVRLGVRSNVQDNCAVHTDAGYPCTIGQNVSIGHGAIIHGAMIDSNCLIGMGAILLNGSKIGSNSIVGAGALVVQGSEIPERSLVLGSPAKVKRPVTDEEIKGISQNVEHYFGFRALYLSRKIL